MSKEEKILREYIEFADINGSETVNILPLTIVDIMQEYSDLQNKELVDKLAEKSELAEKYRRNLYRSQEDYLLEIDRRKGHIKVLQSELTELKEKHKRDVERAFGSGYEAGGDMDFWSGKYKFIRERSEQYYNETHKTK